MSSKLTPAYLWWVFRQWWMVLVPVSAVLAAATATGIMLTYKPDYRATAYVEIRDTREYIAFQDNANPGSTTRYVETQVELLRSPVILELLLARPEIANYEEIAEAEDRIAHLQKNLTISRVGESELYTIAYVSKSPPHSALVANTILEEYLKVQSRDEDDRFQRVIDLLEEERRRRSVDVELLRQKVLKLSEEVTGRDYFSGTTLDVTRAVSPFTSTYMEMTQVDVEREVLRAQIQSYREAVAAPGGSGDSSVLLDLEVANHQSVRDLEARIDELKLRSDAIEADVRPEWLASNATYQQVQREIKQQQAALAELKRELRERLAAERRDRVNAEREESIARWQSELAALDTRWELLSKRFKEELAGVEAGSSKGIELTFAEAELEREEKVYEMIESRKLAMQTERRAPARITVRQRAVSPTLPVSKAPVKILVLALAGCLAAPFGLALAREMSLQRVCDVEQLSRETSLRVISEVSHFPIRRAAANLQSLPPKQRRQMFVYLESIDALRTSLSLAQPNAESRVITVTSAAAAEGKTCLATSLAVSMGNVEKKPVLVIDGDMRAPDVASVLGTKAGPGLAEYLTNQAKLSDVIQRLGKTNTYVIAAGRLRGNPHHVVREDRVGVMLGELRSHFSTIIIDTPPIFGGSESLVFAKLADSVLLSTMRDVSRTKQISHAVERLERAGASVAGAVLNGASAASYAYSYGYGHYSGRLDPPDA